MIEDQNIVAEIVETSLWKKENLGFAKTVVKNLE